MFRGTPDILVVGEASDGEEAIHLVRRQKPDVVVVDISMPRTNGIEVTRQIEESNPAAHCISHPGGHLSHC